jgi:predicted double-glycine peptidase
MRFHRIPAGAIKIDLPDVRQPDNFSCGAGVFMSIASYNNVGPLDLEEIKEALGTNSESGTYYRRIVDYANRLGLNASVQIGMTRRQLIKLIDQRIPVILSMQAYALDPVVYKDPDHQDDGHYIAAIGYDKRDNFYFMDPSITARRGYLPWRELDKRWQENEGWEVKEFYRHLGIIVRPGRRRGGPRALRID